MEGRERDERLVTAIERLADANEAIVKLAGEQQEEMNAPTPGPPFCPHCGTFNPPVQQLAAGGGPMQEFILVAQCERCGKVLYGIPEGWQLASTEDEARSIIEKGGNEE